MDTQSDYTASSEEMQITYEAANIQPILAQSDYTASSDEMQITYEAANIEPILDTVAMRQEPEIDTSGPTLRKDNKEIDTHSYYAATINPDANISLHQFLSSVAVSLPATIIEDEIQQPDRLPDDNDVEIYEALPANTKDIINIAAMTLVELPVYNKAIGSLSSMMNENNRIISLINDEINKKNPKIFTELRNSNADFVVALHGKLTSLKEYAITKSIEETYAWWNEQLKMILDGLRRNSEKLEDDMKTLNAQMRILRKLEADILNWGDQLTIQLKEAHANRQKYESIDYESLTQLEREMLTQNDVLTGLEENKAELEKSLKDLLDAKASAEEENELIKKEVEELESKMNETVIIPQNSIVELEDYYEHCSSIGQWKVLQSGDCIELTVANAIVLSIDQPKLNEKVNGAIYIKNKGELTHLLGDFSVFISCFDQIIKDNKDLGEIVLRLTVFWNRLKLFRQELYDVSTLFYTVIQPIPNPPDNRSVGVHFDITLFNYELKTKLHMIFDFTKGSIDQFPSFIRIDRVDIKVDHSRKSVEEIRYILDKHMSMDGFCNIRERLSDALYEIGYSGMHRP
ncbi:Spc7 kinetochore protein-domain-containing protein [Pilobolus umbonatus]|nr:Spc7 kinetochore protein-domain-containing protein [Pilobolus umbonatus]